MRIDKIGVYLYEAISVTSRNMICNIIAPLSPLGVSIDSQDTIVISPPSRQGARSVLEYADRTKTESWEEVDSRGTHPVTVKIWTQAIQATLDENRAVFIPNLGMPYYIDAPLRLRSGHHLIADPGAEIRLKPGTDTCMLRNEHQQNGQNAPVTFQDDSDHDITIEGGIWTTLAVDHEERNGNYHGGPDPVNDLHGHGVILLNSIRRVRVRNLTIKECFPHGLQLSNVSEFVVERIYFDHHQRDGVHVNGPASFGIIRTIRGETGDDMIALNAWDWKNTSMTFGSIHHVIVEDIHADSPDSEYRADIRFLGGTKHFPCGQTVDCDIESIAVRNISGVRTFKMYDQPNLELGSENDFAEPIGNFKNFSFNRIIINNPSGHPFPIASNVDGLEISEVTLAYNKPADFTKLIQIGPMSATYKPDPGNPATWVEIFSPNKDCIVRNLKMSKIQTQVTLGSKTTTTTLLPQDGIEMIIQKINPNYPRTTPQGGTGKGIWIS